MKRRTVSDHPTPSRSATGGFAAFLEDIVSVTMTNLEQAVESFVQLDVSHVDESTGFLLYAADLYELTRRISLAIPHCDRETITAAVAPARARLAESPLHWRCQTWPRGFPGDYETVETMLNGQTLHPPGSFVYHAEKFFRLSTPVQQHRNKIAHQAMQILETWSRHGADARILILGAGGCPDVRMILPIIAVNPPQLVLVDFDSHALAFARQHLAEIESSCRFVQANVARSTEHARRRMLSPGDGRGLV